MYRAILGAAAVLGLVAAGATSAAANAYVIVDSPKAQGIVASSFVVGGWAIDQAARTDSGVSQLHVWAYPANGGAPMFLGDITHGARPDVAAYFGPQFAQAGFSVIVNNLAPGPYTLVIFPYSSVRNTFDYDASVSVPITVAASSVAPAAPQPAAPAPAPAPSSGSELRLLQWNTHHGGYGTDGVYSPDRDTTWAAQMNPDVITFNEIEKNDSWGNQDQPEVYKNLLQQKTGKTWYYVFAQEFGQWSANGKGNLILSTYPIKVSGGKRFEVANERGVPWRQEFASEKERTRALLQFGREAFGTDFLDAIPLRAKAGDIEGVAYILPHEASLAARRAHRVYLKNMLLSESADNLLPDWAFFVKAVVNANDLRPTASRETFYDDEKLAAARDALGDCLRSYLVNLAEKRPEKLEKFIDLHFRALKALAAEDDEVYRLFIDYLPFETSHGRMTFGEYRREHDTLLFAPTVDQFRQISRVALAQGRCVINAGYAYDHELLTKAPDVFDDLAVEELEASEIVETFDDLTLDECLRLPRRD